MKISEYKLQLRRKNPRLYVSIVKTFVFLLFIYFSYNWPAQTDGVDYGDADEVNKNCKICCTSVDKRFK